MTSRYCIGIDPGVNGGVAVLCADGAVLLVAKMPETDRDLLDLLRQVAPASRAYLEAIHAMPPMLAGGRSGGGSVGNFKLGQSDGRLRMLLAALEIPFDIVSPLKWQTTMQCRTKGDKNVSKARAQALFPNVKITHALADALLIAEYGRRQNHREGTPA